MAIDKIPNAQYLKEIEQLDERIEELQKQKATIREDWIRDRCPFKVGDTVAVNGYSYHGKEMIVDKISVKIPRSRFDRPTAFRAIGRVIKKSDGLPSHRQIGERYETIDFDN